jgi:hypothetical protein
MGANASGQITGIGTVLKVVIFLFIFLRDARMISCSDCQQERGFEVHQRDVEVISRIVQLSSMFQLFYMILAHKGHFSRL